MLAAWGRSGRAAGLLRRAGESRRWPSRGSERLVRAASERQGARACRPPAEMHRVHACISAEHRAGPAEAGGVERRPFHPPDFGRFIPPIVSVSLRTIAFAMPSLPTFVDAATTAPMITAISSSSPTYSTVPCPSSRRPAPSATACSRPISRYAISSLPVVEWLGGQSPATGVAAPDANVTTLRSLARGMRALVLSDMAAGPDAPGRGVFVRDQVAALRRLPGLDVELDEAPPGAGALAALAVRSARRRGFDVVHAHYGLTAWPALAVRGARRAVTLHGTDLRHPRPRRITLAALDRLDLVATVSADLATEVPGAGTSRRVAVLPCGVSLARCHPIPRPEARAALGLPADEPVLLFPADPARRGKRFDRARAVAGDTRLLTLGAVAPDEVPLWINAANAVLVPSDAEGFGLAVLEALACDVPVLATPVGVHPQALDGVSGALCAPFDEAAWRAALAPHLAAEDPRVAGRARAEQFSADAMAERVAIAWREIAG